MAYQCLICDKKYKSSQSLWNHKNKYHQNKQDKTDSEQSCGITNKKYICSKCGKLFSYPQSRWLHETKKCLPKINLLEDEIIVLKNEINELKIKPNIVYNNTIQNYNTHNNIIIPFLPGCETIEYFTNDEKVSL